MHQNAPEPPIPPVAATHITGSQAEPQWHNPQKLRSPGAGYRFCLITETEEDATDWWDNSLWAWTDMYDTPRERFLKADITYRTDKPLP